jgi:hypothetical protein
LGTGILFNLDDGTTGTLYITNIGAGLTLDIGTMTLSTTGTGFNVVWYTVTVSTAMQTSSGYIANGGALVTLTLPATAAIGDALMILGRGAGLWAIAQAAGQVIHFGNVSTTTGVGGSITATHRRDTMILVCSVANLEWTVMSSQGSLTIV